MLLFQDLYSEIKKQPSYSDKHNLLKSIQLPVLYEKCKHQKIIKEQFEEFIVAEFNKCIKIARSRSVTPEKSKSARVDMAAPVIEHREKNIFSSKKRNTSRTSSKSSQKAAVAGHNLGSAVVPNQFMIINEYEDEEDSLAHTGKRAEENPSKMRKKDLFNVADMEQLSIKLYNQHQKDSPDFKQRDNTPSFKPLDLWKPASNEIKKVTNNFM